MNLKIIMLHEREQKKSKYYIYHVFKTPKNAKYSIMAESRSIVACEV